ncbi:MAG TPA: DUF167 domain-containing protein [Rhizomicrobium sp.]|nr:DUF167 domain-containing protein [Rhizomicrobium sp.]
MTPWAAAPGGVRLAIRLNPRASRNRIEGVETGADGTPVLKIRLTAPPVDGAANAALIAFLAEILALRKAEIVIRSGEMSRLKHLHLSGDADILAAKLAAAVTLINVTR